jgi:CCCH-type zinc finger
MATNNDNDNDNDCGIDIPEFCPDCMMLGSCPCDQITGAYFPTGDIDDTVYYGPDGPMADEDVAMAAWSSASAAATSALAAPSPDLPRLCSRFVRNSCRFGSKCRFSHDPVRVAKTQATIRGIRGNLTTRGIAPDVCRYGTGCRDAGCTYHDV